MLCGIMFDVDELKNKVLNGYELTKEDAMNLIDAPLDDLTKAANEIRKSFCGNKFDACMLINVKSGRCSENCKFCAQSNHYDTDIEIYPLLSYDELKERSLAIYNSGFKRISYVASGRKVTKKDFETIVLTKVSFAYCYTFDFLRDVIKETPDHHWPGFIINVSYFISTSIASSLPQNHSSD